MIKLKYIPMALLALATVGFTACEDDVDDQTTAMTISKVYLEDAKSTVPDREVEFARLGQLLRIEGSGFSGLKRIYINGYKTDFNNALMTDNNVWVTLSTNTPVDKADASVRNTIRFVKDGTETIHEFTIRAASPSISGISRTLPHAGETVVVSGANLQETTSLTLPGGVEVTDITCDPDGEWYSFVMPEGVTEGGSITSVGANGTAITPAMFNESRGIILDFDGNGEQGAWSATYAVDQLADDPLGLNGKCCPAVPEDVLATAGIKNGAHGNGWFTAGNDSEYDDWSRFYDLIPATTPVEDIAFQFDIYVPEEWSGAGYLEFTFQNNLSGYGWGSTNTKAKEETDNGYMTAVCWVPWLADDGTVVPYKTDGWQTVTIPVSNVGRYQIKDTFTFADVVSDRNNGSYRNFGMFLVNNDIEFSDDVTITTGEFNQMVYTDNWRLVPSASITVSDFDDEE